MDLLLRRYAHNGGNSSARSETAPAGDASQHLDADQLNAFAEGVLPAAARSRYVSHLADCNRCRRLATELAMAAGLTVAVEAETARKESAPASYSLWDKLTGLFAVTKLRYAAFALVVVAAAGVGFLALRRQREPQLVAENRQVEDRRGDAVTKAEQPPTPANPSASIQTGAPSSSAASNGAGTTPQQPGSVNGANGPVLAEPPKGAAGLKDDQVTEEKKEAPVAQAQPAYAPPPPPGDQREVAPRTTESRGVPATQSELGKNRRANQNFGAIGQMRSGEAGNRDMDERQAGKLDANRNETAGRDKAEDALASRRAEQSNNDWKGKQADQPAKAAPDTKPQPVKTESATVTSGALEARKEQPLEMRKVAGHNFHRQNSEWVDAKFKTSMSVRNISRNSDEFRTLDSGLRSIAGQLNGEVVVVWKGHAYRIR
jgi:hypothetical protein